MTKDIDADAMTELDLYIENESSLYNQKLSIIANVKRRLKKGTYRPSLAVTLWHYLIENGARSYCREYGGTLARQFPKKLRLKLAAVYADEYLKGILNGEY